MYMYMYYMEIIFERDFSLKRHPLKAQYVITSSYSQQKVFLFPLLYFKNCCYKRISCYFANILIPVHDILYDTNKRPITAFCVFCPLLQKLCSHDLQFFLQLILPVS